MRLTVKQLKELLNQSEDDFVIRVGSDNVERFAYLTAIGEDNDTGTFILYFDENS